MRKGFVLLLVEDDPVLGPITAEALEIFSHATTVVTTVESAFHAICNTEFDAILLDLGLGDDRGETLIEKAREAGMRVPTVLILSAFPISHLQKIQQSLGASAAIQKPATIGDLAQALETYIPVSQAERESLARP